MTENLPIEVLVVVVVVVVVVIVVVIVAWFRIHVLLSSSHLAEVVDLGTFPSIIRHPRVCPFMILNVLLDSDTWMISHFKVLPDFLGHSLDLIVIFMCSRAIHSPFSL